MKYKLQLLVVGEYTRINLFYHSLNLQKRIHRPNTQYGIGVFKEYIKTSAGQFTINQNGIKSLTIPLPHISLQNKFTEKVKTIEKQKQFLNQSLELLEENYKSIMDKAFKGQLFN